MYFTIQWGISDLEKYLAGNDYFFSILFSEDDWFKRRKVENVGGVFVIRDSCTTKASMHVSLIRASKLTINDI